MTRLRAIPILVLVTAFATLARADAPRPQPSLTRPPSVVRFVDAQLPESTPRRTAAIEVVLSVVIAADGTVEDATVSSGFGEPYDSAAVAAMRTFLFVPAEIDGAPARIRISYRYVFAAPEPAVPTPPVVASIAGVVTTRTEPHPIVGARVSLDGTASVATDAEGRFRFEAVAPGIHRLAIAGDRLPHVQSEETLAEGESLEVHYEVDEAAPAAGDTGVDVEVVVYAPRASRSASSIAVDADEARRTPGAAGEVVAVLTNLPGVARAAGGSSSFVVWGATPDETGIYVDGVRVPRLYHDGGLRSVVSNEMIAQVELVPGGFGADYGRGIGGLVRVRTPEFARTDRVRATVRADVFDASASVGANLGARAAFSGSFRGSYVAPLVRAVTTRDVESYFALPRYFDGHARVGVALREHEWVDLTVIASHDRTTRTILTADPARDVRDDRTQGFERVYLRYHHDLPANASVALVLHAGRDDRDLVATYGDVTNALRSRAAVFGGRASYRVRPLRWLDVDAGVDAAVESASIVREGSVASPSREGDVRVFGQPLPDSVARDAFRATTIDVAPYVVATASVIRDRLEITAGLRVDPYARIVSRTNPSGASSPAIGLFATTPRAEPRVAVHAALHRAFDVDAAYGMYGQAPAPTDLSSVFGNPALTPTRAQHVVLTGRARLGETLGVEATGFTTWSEGLAMRSPATTPAAAQVLLPIGRGRARGVQSLVRLSFGRHLEGFASYTLTYAERQDAPGLAYRRFDFEQRHLLAVVLGSRLGRGWELGIRFRVATGAPRTAVIGASYDGSSDRFEPVFGEHNAIRLPTFVQLDLRVARRIALRHGELEVSLDLMNATNRTNVEEFVYAADYRARGGIRGLPTIPVLGVRWSP